VTICTDAFEGLAREEAKNLGMPDLPLVIIKHPIGGEPPDVIRQRAEGAAPQVLRALTDGLQAQTTASASREEATARRLIFASNDEVLETYHARRWTDGLPFVLPTVK
jgi:hypothetical protein